MTWTIADSAELYGVPYWGKHLFEINEQGHLVALPQGTGQGHVDLHALTEDLGARGIDLPVLVRMPDIARRRMDLLVRVFKEAMAESEYKGRYRGVYPIKVNQQRRLVEELLQFGRRHHFGLEAGSKAMLDDPDALLICNGYKDRQYIEMALLARKLGRNTVVVVEKASEVRTIIEASRSLGIRPRIGVRAKLSRPGKGRWSSSAGDRAKFGLSAAGIVEVIDELAEAGFLDCLELLHFHIGSQVTAVRSFRKAVREAARLYVDLVRAGAPMGVLDVGGGLAIDYDGSRTDFESSRNYTVAEYASDVVSEIAQACNEGGVAHPDLVTESGRATVAHCTVLLFDVLGTESLPTDGEPEVPEDDAPQVLRDLREVYDAINTRSYQEAFHDANDGRETARQAFELGVIDLRTLARVQRMYWQICGRIHGLTRDLRYVPDELDTLEPALADTYYANFSVFQSIPDSWAVGQLFPVLPVHRLDEEPTRRAVLADLTCDSDGKVDRFVDRRDVKKVLEVHAVRPDEPYIMAFALIGAYQEVLGDMHNLFGTTNAVHVSLDEDGAPQIDRVIEGANVSDAVRTVQYDPEFLIERVRRSSERAMRKGDLQRSEARALMARVRDGLFSYTYLGGNTDADWPSQG
jgi:arginine decarboxylase